MITVGMTRNGNGIPVMVEKAYPTSERIFGQWAPSETQRMRAAGMIVFSDGVDDDAPQRIYSHSSADL